MAEALYRPPPPTPEEEQGSAQHLVNAIINSEPRAEAEQDLNDDQETDNVAETTDNVVDEAKPLEENSKLTKRDFSRACSFIMLLLLILAMEGDDVILVFEASEENETPESDCNALCKCFSYILAFLACL